MNRITRVIIPASLFSVAATQAADEDDDHAAHHPDGDQSQMDSAQDDNATIAR
jgi:hypothetical protein